MNGDDGQPRSIWHALAALQAEAPVLPKDNEATVQTQKGSYRYRYTDLGTINTKIGPLLSKHELAWTACPTGTAAEPKLAYTLAHLPTGQMIQGEMPLLGVDSSQSHGSALTYARRYAKVAVLDLVADEDDDGAGASYHRESRAAPAGGVDLRDRAKGLNDAAINAARATVGLPKLEKPWGSLLNIPEHLAGDFAIALDNARVAS